MARAANARPKAGHDGGFDQSTGQRDNHVPSQADGCTVTALSNTVVQSADASPGAVIGTGQNPDRYTPVLEQV